MSSSPFTQTVRIAVVQLENHPSISIEDRDLAKEPFLSENDGIPLLTRLEREPELKEVSLLKRQFWKRYLAWAEIRLESIFRFLSKLPDDRKPDLVVFPEFSIPFELLWIPAKYTASTANEDRPDKNHWVVVAGNHAYVRSRSAYATAFNQRNYEDDYADPEFGPGRKGKQEDADLPDGFTLPDHESPRSPSAANSLLIVIASPLCFEQSPRVVKTEGQHDSREGPCPCKANNTERIVFARFKTKLSPFEFSSLHKEESSETISAEDVKKWIYKFKTVRKKNKLLEHPYSINVFICAEALQGVVTHSDANIGVVCAYHRRPIDFSRFSEPSVLSRHLVIISSDGAFGCSKIGMNADKRMPDWTREEPLTGLLPVGDIIQISEMPINPVGTMGGSTNPFKSEKLVLLAGIVPGSHPKLMAFYKELRKILKREDAPNWRDDFIESDVEAKRNKQGAVSEKLLALLSRYEVPPILDLKVRALARYANAGQLSLPVLQTLAEDCTTALDRQGGRSDLDDPIFCGSLKGIERDLAEKAYAWLRHRSESGTLSKEAASVAIEAQRKCLRRFRSTATLGPIPAVKLLHAELTRQVKRRAYSNINSLLGIMVERFAASSGWVFLYRSREDEMRPEESSSENYSGPIWPGELEEMVSHNVPLSSSKLILKVPKVEQPELRELLQREDLNGVGICTMSVALKRAILVSDLENSAYKKFYARKLATTKSVISVPIFDTQGDAVKGCLILESDENHSFVTSHIGELQATSTKLLPELLIAESVENAGFAGCWHPELHGWDLGTVLREFSDEIATSLHEVETVQSLSCTVWHTDWDKNVMYVRTAARFNFEYIAERVMPLSSKVLLPERSWMSGKESFTGKVASNKRGKVSRTLISEIADFNRTSKARRMGVAYLVSSPIYAPEETGDTGKSIGVLSLYFFRRQHPRFEFSIDGLFPDHDVAFLTNFFGYVISSTKHLREATARAILSAKLDSEGLPGVDLADGLREVGKEVLSADTASVFAGERLEKTKVKLRVLSSTGIEFKGEGGRSPDSPYDTEYTITECEEDPLFSKVRGITAFLTCHPGSIVRKIDVPDTWEIGSLQLCGSLIADKGLESQKTNLIKDTSVCSEGVFAQPDNEELLFEPQNLTKDSSEPTDIDHRRFLGASIDVKEGASGIMRLTRASGSRPFVRADGDLLLALLQTFKPHFAYSRVQRDKDILRKYLELPDYGKTKWNRRFAESLFQHYLVKLSEDPVFKVYGITFEVAYIRVRAGNGSSPEELRMLYGQSTVTTQIFPRECHESITEWRRSFEWSAVQAASPSIAYWDQNDSEGRRSVELQSIKNRDKYFISPTLISGKGGRLVFVAPFEVTGGGRVPNALLVAEARVDVLDTAFGDEKSKWFNRLLKHSQAVARRLMCISRSNRMAEKEVARFEEALNEKQFVEKFLSHCVPADEKWNKESMWYGLKSISLPVPPLNQVLGNGLTTKELWRELALQNTPVSFESLFPEGGNWFLGNIYKG